MKYDYAIAMNWSGDIEANTFRDAVRATHVIADDIMETLKLIGVEVDTYHKPEIEIVRRVADE